MLYVKKDAAAKEENRALIIRPENLVVSKKPIEYKNNVFKGRIEAKIFLGSTMRLLINLGEKKEIEADIHAKDICPCEAGEDLFVHLPEEKLVFVKA